MTNSTNHQKHPLTRTFSPGRLGALRIEAFRLLARIAPQRAVRMAVDMFGKPPHSYSAVSNQALLDRSEPFNLQVMGNKVQGWSWGSGPIVYLVHGWGGQALSLSFFVESLGSKGYQVVAFDAPGHGLSEGQFSSGIHFSAALQAVAHHFGPARGVVAHSIGATSTAFAVRQGLDVERMVLLGPADDPVVYYRQFLGVIGLPSSLFPAAEQTLEGRLNFHWPDFKVTNYAPEMAVPLLAIHDLNDATVPWTDSAAIVEAWPGARLIKTKGLGHRGLLRDKQVIGQAEAFLSGSSDNL